MITLPRFVALLSLMLGVGSLRAQVILDEFIDGTIGLSAPTGTSSTDTSVFIQNTDPEHTYPAQRHMVVEVMGNSTIFAMVNSNLIVNGDRSSLTGDLATLQMDYYGFNINLADNTVFNFSVQDMIGSAIASIQVTSANSSNVLLGAVSLEASSSPQEYSIDLTQLQGYTPNFLSAFNGITIDIFSSDDFSLQGNDFSFTSVPEPSASGLALAGGLGLAWLWRRKRPLSQKFYPHLFIPFGSDTPKLASALSRMVNSYS